MNSLEYIEFVMLVVQYYDLQTKIFITWGSSKETKRIATVCQVFVEFANAVMPVLEQLIKKRKSPTVWEKERSSSFWEIDCQVFSAADFKYNFRVERGTFFKLCRMLQCLEKEDTNFRKAIPLQKRVAIALYAIGSSGEYRTVGHLFGVSTTSVCRIVKEFCEAVWQNMQPVYLNDFPLTEASITTCVRAFEEIGFPQCLGALDGCHIEVKPRKEEAVDYFNYKGWYSVVLLALVDARYRFLYINIGSPGRCNDSAIYESSLLKKELFNCSLLQDLRKTFSSTEIPVIIIADSAFRLSRNLLKPYPFTVEASSAQKEFNYRLSSCRRVVENAFGHIKARFRRLGKGLDNHMDNVNGVVKACCVLHNFFIEENDEVPEIWLNHNSTTQNRLVTRSTEQRPRQNNEGEIFRNALSEHFLQS